MKPTPNLHRLRHHGIGLHLNMAHVVAEFVDIRDCRPNRGLKRLRCAMEHQQSNVAFDEQRTVVTICLLGCGNLVVPPPNRVHSPILRCFRAYKQVEPLSTCVIRPSLTLRVTIIPPQKRQCRDSFGLPNWSPVRFLHLLVGEPRRLLTSRKATVSAIRCALFEQEYARKGAAGTPFLTILEQRELCTSPPPRGNLSPTHFTRSLPQWRFLNQCNNDFQRIDIHSNWFRWQRSVGLSPRRTRLAKRWPKFCANSKSRIKCVVLRCLCCLLQERSLLSR